MRMLVDFINRSGKGPSPSRRAKMERAKKLGSERIKKARQVLEKKAA